METRIVTGLFESYDTAKQAVLDLEAAGIPHAHISIVANNTDYRIMREEPVTEGAGAATGASIGTIVGGGAGLLAGLGMIAIPGIGPVVAAGWLASTALGAAVGAATGGIIGAMTDAGMTEEDAERYAEGIRRGGTLVSAKVTMAQLALAEGIIAKYNAIDPETRAAAYRAEGWKGFDHSGPTYPLSEAEKERARFGDQAR
jgi:hypothetical protein